MITNILNNLEKRVGKIGDRTYKHRTAILYLSIIMLLIDFNVKLTIGKASLAGIGITVAPAQSFSIASILFVLLLYRLCAFLALALIENGTNSLKARENARIKIEPALRASRVDTESLIREQAESSIHAWGLRRLTWDFIFPVLVALLSMGRYILYSYFQ